MATRFDSNILMAARRLHDERSDATSGGDGNLRFTSALLVKYENQAIRDITKEQYLKFLDNFRSVMPEMVKLSAAITPTYVASIGEAVVPTDCWIALEVAKSDLSLYYNYFTKDPLKVQVGRDPFVVPTTTKPFWTQETKTDGTRIVKTFGPTAGDVKIYYVVQMTDMIAGAGQTVDIPLSPVWDGEIIERMVAFGLADSSHPLAQG